MIYLVFLLIVGIIIIVLGLIAGKSKMNNIEINQDIQKRRCPPQAIILKNGQVILAQIDLSYRVIDTPKAKNAVKNGINIFIKLEYEGITNLRKIVENVDDAENIIVKLEYDLKKKLSETAQEFGIEIIELHITFGNKNDFNIESNNYISAIEEIRNADNEKENNVKYKFDVSLKTIFGKWISRNTKFKTKINIINDRLKYELSRKYESSSKWFKHGERKYNTFTEGERDIYIDDIVSIKYKIGFTFALNFFDFIAFLCAIIGIAFSITCQLSFWRLISTGLEKNPINFNYMPSVIFLLSTILFIWYFTCKCIEIKYRTNEGVKKIVFPVGRTFFISVPISIRRLVNSLFEEIKQKKQNIRIKKDRLKWILICYIIIVSIIYISVPIYLRQKYLRDNELTYNINNDLVYCDVSFDKGKVVDIKNERSASGNFVSKYVFELTSGEKIEIQGYSKEYGKTYSICLKKYYKKDSNQLFKTEYLVRNDSNVSNVWVDATDYVYDYIGNKMYKFNFLNNDNVADFGTKIYYREIGNANTLYNFINYNNNTLTITNDFDVKEFKSNNYETIQKIDTYTSEYGMCYIMKAIYNGKVDYLMYIENQNKTNLNELDAILLNSRIDRTGSFSNDDKAKKSFRIICPER